MFDLTENQLKAIEADSKLVVVSSSAGAGKTSVLVERVIKLLKSGVKLNNLLIVTFTRNSAFEMKNRIKKKLNNDKEVRHCLEHIDDSSFCTIDSFCLNTIKKHNQDIQFQILNKKDNLYIISKIIESVIDEIYIKNDAKLNKVIDEIDMICSGGFIVDIKNKLLLIFITMEKYVHKLKKIDICAFVDKYLNINLSFVLEFLQKSIDFCTLCPELREKYLPSVKYDFDLLKKMQSYNSIEFIINLQKFSFSKLKSVKNSKFKSNVQTMIEYSKKIINNFKLIDIDFENSQNLSTILDEFIPKIKNEVYKFKSKYNFFDFSDVELMVLDLLRYDSTIRKKYKYVLIDEYQDVNMIQNNIFDLISENLFVVGDYKQSIYGFRGAFPEAFYNKKKHSLLINLNENFRSNAQILKFVNNCFSQIMTKKTNLIDYENEEKFLFKDNIQNSNDRINIYLLSLKSEKAKIIHEIEFVADVINEKISSKAQIFGRNIQFSDFCVLIRNYNKYSYQIHKSFKKRNIKIKSNNLSDLLKCNEIYNLILLLQAIITPNDDINLVAVLMSPIFNFSTFELAKVRQIDDNCEFYLSIEKYCDSYNDLLKEKCKLFLDFIHEAEYRYKSDSLFNFVLFVIDEIEDVLCNYYKIKNDNFLKFLYLTNKFSQENCSKNIKRLIDYIENQTYDSIENIFTIEDAVSVASIHKSKGKEYPICFLVGCGDEFVKKYDDIMFDPEFGISFKSNTKKANIKRKYMEFTHRYKIVSEEMRILYVALTRAKEELHIVLSSYNAERDLKKAEEKANMFENIHPYFIRSARNFLEWFLMLHFKFEEYNFEVIDMTDESDGENSKI